MTKKVGRTLIKRRTLSWDGLRTGHE